MWGARRAAAADAADVAAGAGPRAYGPATAAPARGPPTPTPPPSPPLTPISESTLPTHLPHPSPPPRPAGPRGRRGGWMTRQAVPHSTLNDTVSSVGTVSSVDRDFLACVRSSPARTARTCCARLWRGARERVRPIRVQHAPCRRTHAARLRRMMMSLAEVSGYWPLTRILRFSL